LRPATTQIGPDDLCPAPGAQVFSINFADRWILLAMKRMVEPDGGEWVARLLREHVQKKLKTSFSWQFANSLPRVTLREKTGHQGHGGRTSSPQAYANWSTARHYR
jgi:hypothetical protein